MANLVAGQRVGIEHAADLLERALRIFAGADVRQVDEDVLARAAGAFPLPIATLDAIHVATALEVQQWHDVTELVLLSRDKQVRDVAAALGMQLA